MAAPISGAKPCPANFSAAADRKLSSFQEEYLWPVLVAEFLVALAGNGLALFGFCKREARPWHPAVVFSAQLAASNLLYALTLPPLAAYFYPPKNWRYGLAACRLERFLSTCNLLGGGLFLTCISLNRYLGVAHPFFTRAHLRPKHAWAVSAAGWALAALLAAPTLGFAHLSQPGPGAGPCSVNAPHACFRCVGMAEAGRLAAYRAYGLALAGLGGALPLLLTLAAFGALGRAVLRSHGLTAPEKRRVVLLVAGGVALYAGSYLPYYVTHALNVDARLRWQGRCPGFASEAQAVGALELGTYLGYQVTRGLVPLATCIHPLLYMAVVSSLTCRRLRCTGCTGDRDLEDERPGQDLPLAVPSGPHRTEPSPGPGPSQA